MAWLCVNKDGQELICENRPVRSGYVERNSIYNTPYLVKPQEWEYDKVKEFTFWDSREDTSFSNCDFNLEMNLPDGTIEKIIGKKINLG